MKTLTLICLLFCFNTQAQTLTVCPTIDTVLYSYDSLWSGVVKVIGDCNFIYMEGTLDYHGVNFLSLDRWYTVLTLPTGAEPKTITLFPCYVVCFDLWYFLRALPTGEIQVGGWNGSLTAGCSYIIPNGFYQHN